MTDHPSAYYVWAEIGTFKGDPNNKTLEDKDDATWWGRRVSYIRGNVTVSARTKTETLNAVGGRVNQYIGGHKIYRVILPANLSEVVSVSLRLDTDDEERAKETIVLSRKAIKVTSPLFGQRAIFVREKARLQLNAENVYVRPRRRRPSTTPVPPRTSRPPSTAPTDSPAEPTEPTDRP